MGASAVLDRPKVAKPDKASWWAVLKEGAAHPDPELDKDHFDRKWSRNGKIERKSRSFHNGKLAHQVSIAKRLNRDLERSRAGLDAIANEAKTYLTAFTILLAGVSFLLSGKANLIWQSPYRLAIWPLAAVLLLLLGSHASPLSSWWTNYQGAGEKAAESTTEYKYVNSVREEVLRYNQRLQRAKRLLALVQALVVLMVLTTYVMVTIG